MEIEHVPTVRLAEMAAPYNPRKCSDHDMEALRRSLRFFGTVEPIVVNRRSGRVVGGHQRIRAAEAEGIDTLPVVHVDLDDPSEKQLNLALNRIHGEFDLDKLAALLSDLELAGADLAFTGFTDDEIRDLIHGGDVPADGLTDPDLVPEPPDDPMTQPGDLIILGRHRLLCGDSADPAAVELLLGGERIHLVNTDPPYNVRVEPRSNNAIAANLAAGRRASTKGNVPSEQLEKMHHQGLDLARHPGKSKPTGKMRAKDRPLENDFVSDEAFAAMLDAWFGNLSNALEPGRSFFIWGGYSNLRNYPGAIEDAGLYFSQAIIWDKEWPVLTRKDFMGAHEWCQPPGTMVLTPHGEMPIETLADGDHVTTFSRSSGAMIGAPPRQRRLFVSTPGRGRPLLGAGVRAAQRHYTGEMFGISANNAVTWSTAGHLWSIKLQRDRRYSHCVYLMRRGRWWRVGKSKFWTRWGFGLKHRLYSEGGEDAWILSVHSSNVDAMLAEQLASVKYGIPTTYWNVPRAVGGGGKRDSIAIQRLYDSLDPDELAAGALRALADHHRRFEHPFVRRDLAREKYGERNPVLVRACNFLPEVMSVPVPDGTKRRGNGQKFHWMPASVVGIEKYDGTVYSMDVDKHHHYVADGIVTHNCYYGWKEGAAHYFNPEITNATDLWRVKKVTPGSMIHLTEKPVELAERAMLYSSRRDENVLDLFGGSGSTLIAAERMGRRAFLMELDPAYADTIIDRWQRFTGKAAIVSRTGELFPKPPPAVVEEMR